MRLRQGYLPRLLRGKHLILTFHRIRPVTEPRNTFDTCPNHRVDHFRLILDNIQSQYQIVPLAKLRELWHEKNRLAVITFDDGWRDTFDVAVPVLSSMGIPATIFVTTDKIGSHTPFWQQILGKAFRLASDSQDGVVAEKLRSTFGLSADAHFTPETFKRTVMRIKQNYQRDTDDCIFDELGPFVTNSENERLFLSEEEIAKLATEGYEIGSHTVSHPILTKVNPKQLTSELVESKNRLEKITGRVIDSIAYPNGSYDSKVMTLAKETGYRVGCTTRSARLVSGHELLELPRVEPFWDMNEERIPTAASQKTLSLQAGQKSLVDPISAAKECRKNSSTTTNSHVAKLRVLFVMDQFFDIMGGTEQHLVFLCQNLPDVDTHVQFAALTRICRCDEKVFGVPVQILVPESGIPGIGFLRRVWRLSRLIAREQIDVIQPFCPTSEFASVLAVRIARRGKVVGCRRNTGYWHSKWTIWRSRLVGRLTNHLVANCKAAKDFSVKREWIPGNRISVIQNPVDLERLRRGEADPYRREQQGIKKDELVVAMVASVRPIKDQGTLLRAAQLVLEHYPQTRFLLVGDAMSDYKKQLESLSDSLGITPNISWTGPIINPYQLLSLVDVGVLPSLSEGYSNALLEYAAAGVPAVATDVGGSSEIVVDGITGYLVPSGSHEKLADRVLHLLTNPGLAREMGQKARERVFEKNAPKFVVDSYHAVYRKALQGTRSTVSKQ